MEQVQFSAGRGSEWPNRFRPACKTATLCGGEETEINQRDEIKTTELNGVEERETTECQMKAGDGVGGELAPPDWRLRAGLRNGPTQKEREEHEAMHVPFTDWCTHCMMGR